jgi:hypothetical protein
MSDHSNSPSAGANTASRMVVGGTVSRVFVGAPLRRVSVGEITLEETVRELAELADAAIGGSDMVGVTMLVAERPRTAVSTDDTVSEVEDVQFQSGIGPCLEACAERPPSGWTRQTPMTAGWVHSGRGGPGILSSMSVPLVARHQGIGAVNCYSRRPVAFSAADECVAATFPPVRVSGRHGGGLLGRPPYRRAPRPGCAGAVRHRIGQRHVDGCSAMRRTTGSTWFRLPHDKTATFVVEIVPGCDN